MGVHGLWTILQPCARPTNLATLNRKRLAVDASIWIYQFLKAVRDKEGNALRNSHVIGFFRRICKLLWFGILPVFVFDGGAPTLKRSTLQARRQRREGRRDDAVRTAGKLLAVQMQRIAEEEAEKRRQRRQVAAVEAGAAAPLDTGEDGMAPGEALPSAEELVYAGEAHMTQQERLKSRKFTKQDAYHLPELAGGSIEGMGRPEDPRIMSIDELEEYARQFDAGEDINLYDFSKIDFDGDFFKSLPPPDRYNILNAARIRSRLRMGLSKEQLDGMFPDRMAFSRFQIERVRERNHLTQRLMLEVGMTGLDLTMGVNARVAGEKDREYILVKNDGAEGGWALGVVSREKDRGEAHKPIDVDALQFRYDGDEAADNSPEDSDEDADFQDVPIEGLNRLPKLAAAGALEEADEDSLFVPSYEPVDTLASTHTDDREGDSLRADEEEDLSRAIAMSLQNQHGGKGDEEEEEEDTLKDVPPPEWTQKTVEAARPIGGSTGQMVAHIVNNRSSAAVAASVASSAKARETLNNRHMINDSDDDSGDSSDSELDMRAALAAAARKQKKAPKPAPSAPERPQTKNPFAGPLPFETLDWRTSIFEKRPVAAAAATAAASATAKETGSLEPASDDDGLAGGFIIEADDGGDVAPGEDTAAAPEPEVHAPLPLPPWMVDDTDIRTAIRQQQIYGDEINAQDREMALAEERLWQRQPESGIVEISSDDGSDVEVLDAPPKPAVSTSSTPAQIEQPPTPDVATAVAAEAPDAVEKSRSSSPEATFEDVVLPERAAAAAVSPPLEKALSADAREEDLFTGEDGDDPFAVSDAEEEELLAQMTEEAEEHARFASELNHRTAQEKEAAFAQELQALRQQQKKDRRDADEVTQVMVSECQALLRLFGIPYITAPMEAEAQCAELVALGLVDGIVTDDSDTFLFGGTRVYKNMFNGNKFVECYLGADFEKELSLSRPELIALAQLLGSDYTEGLPGVGPVTAMEILSEFPGPDGLAAFRDWWQDVQSHGRAPAADAASPFRRKFRKAQAAKLFLPVSFPSPAVAEAYLRPEVDRSTEPVQWGVPDLDGLRSFLMATIGWSQERTDEVLVPVIRDMNRREAEGTQSNITRFFSGSVGVGARLTEAQQRAQERTQEKDKAPLPDEFAPRHAPRNKTGASSRRMAAAVSRLKAKTAGDTDATDATNTNTQAKGRKRKSRAPDVEEADDQEQGHGRPQTRRRGRAK